MICLICKKNFKDITNTHLKLHGLTRKEYKKLDKEFAKFLCQRMSEIAKGKTDVKRGKKYEDIVGEERAKQWKERIGLKFRGIKRPPFSESHKRKLSETRKGQRNSPKTEFRKGQIPWTKGKFGKNHPSWQGGKSFEPYTIDWTEDLRRAIRKRDEYTCQMCGRESAIHCHHVDYNKENCDPKNLITLCRSCHSKTNFNRKHWIKKFLVICFQPR